MIHREYVFKKSTDHNVLQDVFSLVNSLPNCEILYTEHNIEKYYNHQIDCTVFGLPFFKKNDPLFKLKFERFVDSVKIVMEEDNRIAFVDVFELEEE